MSSLPKRLAKAAVAGALAGLGAGLFNSIIIWATGAWATIGVKFQVAAIQAFSMHLLFSAISGLLFALLVGRHLQRWRSCLLAGALFSIGVYLLAAFIVMPIRFGASPSLGWDFFRVLIGHTLFGLVLAALYLSIRRRWRW